MLFLCWAIVCEAGPELKQPLNLRDFFAAL